MNIRAAILFTFFFAGFAFSGFTQDTGDDYSDYSYLWEDDDDKKKKKRKKKKGSKKTQVDTLQVPSDSLFLDSLNQAPLSMADTLRPDTTNTGADPLETDEALAEEPN